MKKSFILIGALAATCAGAVSASAQIIPLFTNNFSQSYNWPGSPDGKDGRFGESIVSLGNGRYAVAAPKADLPTNPATNSLVLNEVGVVRVFATNSTTIHEFPAVPDYYHHLNGRELSAFAD